ncbi:MAG: hypothetical protein J5I93_05560 [Pirellulaceae bacterium]|nr:hypothetical protein [Pirellulaceae bacterium]
MITASPDTRRYVAVSTPGGPARHFRVQFRRPSELDWRLCASFQVLEAARDREAQLRHEGFQARVVEFRICPATM